MRKISLLLVALALMVLAAMPVFAQSDGTIIEVAADSGDFSTLLTLLDAAGWTATLNGPGPYTVFAPTDAAFDAFLAVEGLTLNDLTSSPALAEILKYHVVTGDMSAASLATVRTVTSVQGSPIYIRTAVGGGIILNNETAVIGADIAASNGTIHAVDYVLLPPLSYDPPLRILSLVDNPIVSTPGGEGTGLFLRACQTADVTGYSGGYFEILTMGGWIDINFIEFVSPTYGQPGGQAIAPQCVGK